MSPILVVIVEVFFRQYDGSMGPQLQGSASVHPCRIQGAEHVQNGELTRCGDFEDRAASQGLRPGLRPISVNLTEAESDPLPLGLR